MIENFNELRLGNYVKCLNLSGEPICKIYSIEGPLPRKNAVYNDQYVITVMCDGLDTSPGINYDYAEITDSILRKFGFDKNTCTLKIPVTDEESEDLYFGKDLDGNIRIIQGEYYIGNSIKYIHHLQNMYYDLSGEELRIVEN